jgi:ankyrin repeat protein
MDAKFHPAIDAIKSGDLDRFRVLVREDPTLATSRSSRSHPTLLQCLVLDGKDLTNKMEMANILINAGAELNGPLVACASGDNEELAELLLDRGGALNGTGGWSPLEEALYWNSRRTLALLLRRGASIHNLRIAAGLGRTDLIEAFFNPDGTLKPEAGSISWPWENSRQPQMTAKALSWANDHQGIVNNAFVYACMHGHIEAARLLLARGAQVNRIPGGFDFAGSGLHYAALNGHREMTEFLLQHGADPDIKDEKVGSTPAGWAAHAGHPELHDYLKAKENSR